MVLEEVRPIDENPLKMVDLPDPEPGPGQVRLEVQVCALCHTDLHIIEGELAPHLRPVVPGHQIIGRVDKLGPGVTRFKTGDRLGVPWLYHTDQTCHYCQTGHENLCEHGQFTGYDANGGYAQYHTVNEEFTYPIPENFSDEQAAPLLCSGVVGFRALRLSEIKPGGRLGIWGFGASAHINIQVALHWNCEVFVFTRSEEHQRLARQLGAVWAGPSGGPEAEKLPRLDSGVIYAPAGSLVIDALKMLDKSGTLALGGIYMTPIPQFDYNILWSERTVRSVANSTRQDVIDLLQVASEIPVRSEVEMFSLSELNSALQKLKHSKINGSGVVRIKE
jgi:propanol-preferring alcohol dehydrogenase